MSSDHFVQGLSRIRLPPRMTKRPEIAEASAVTETVLPPIAHENRDTAAFAAGAVPAVARLEDAADAKVRSRFIPTQ